MDSRGGIQQLITFWEKFFTTTLAWREIFSPKKGEKDLADDLMRKIDAVEQFLNFLFLEHILSDGDISHNPDISLPDLSTKGGTDNVFQNSCKICLAAFELFRNIENSVTDQRTDAKEALCDFTNRTILYMGLQNSFHHQELRISHFFFRTMDHLVWIHIIHSN